MANDHITGLYVTVPVYFVLLACCAIWANKKNRQEVQQSPNGGSHRQTDRLSSHYLGGRDLGPILSSGTIFASFFSGYTVVGIPTEAFNNGFLAFRWVAMALAVVTGMAGTVLRLRKVALVRNHKTSVDFVTDRFQSQVLRGTMIVLQIVPSLFYATAQVVALKSTFNSIFELDPDTVYPVLIIIAVTLLFEWIGGLRCVAMTDCVQAAIMILAYICLPIIIRKNFGGWIELDPQTYPRPDFYRTPSWDAQLNFWQFGISAFTFFTLPHLMQRAYAASDLRSLKAAYFTMTCGMWLLMFGGVFIGTVGVSILEGRGHVANPLTAILKEVMDLGKFPFLVGLIAITASIAAIMSTVDSLLVAISQLVTEEIAYPLRPNSTPAEMAWVGRAVSFMAVIIATTLGLTWVDGIAQLADINFQLSFQTLFIFLIGLFGYGPYDCHPWSLAAGAATSFIYIFGIYFGYLRSCSDCGSLNAGMTGILVQFGVLLIFEVTRRWFYPEDKAANDANPAALIFPNRPAWDVPKRARFGERPLTPNLLWRMMEGVEEPLANPWFASLMFVTISIITPFVAPGLPRDLGALQDGIVNSLPWWAVRMFVFALIPTIFLLTSVYRMPNQYTRPETESSRQDLGDPSVPKAHVEIDPDIMELTPEELGYRTSYDGRNELVYQRRMQLMQKLGISPSDLYSVLEATHDGSSQEETNNIVGEASEVRVDLE